MAVEGTLVASRLVLQRVAAHVLARRRYEVTGRFGLRAAPGGLATPAFGPGPETVRLAGSVLVHEDGGTVRARPLVGSSLRDLATLVGADISADFSVGADTPALGDVDAPLEVEDGAVAVVADWFWLSSRILDVVIAEQPAGAEPAVVQLWPEHFDVGSNVGVGNGAVRSGGGGAGSGEGGAGDGSAAESRANLGGSPGDGFSPEPYLYLGPWGAERPGPGEYWNAPFGSVLYRSDLLRADDPVQAGADFLRAGLRLLRLRGLDPGAH